MTDPILDRTTGASADLSSDARLVNQLIDGSEAALASLYDRHAHAVYAVAMRTTRDPSTAAEVVQETFLTLWNRAELFDSSRGSLPAWLVTIARNRALDRLRAIARHDRAATFSSFGRFEEHEHAIADWLTASGELIAASGPEPGPDVVLSNKETRAAVANALASLTPEERRVIVLAYDQGLSQSEIAAELGWPVGTVKTRTRRALRQLRDRFERTQAGEQAEEPPRSSGAGWITRESATSSQSAVPEVGQGDRRLGWSTVGASSRALVASPCQG